MLKYILISIALASKLQYVPADKVAQVVNEIIKIEMLAPDTIRAISNIT